jgi:hypothetical protein
MPELYLADGWIVACEFGEAKIFKKKKITTQQHLTNTPHLFLMPHQK